MATAKKLEFQAERKAAAWQGGKPQPAPLPADVHAATCLVDSDGEAARTAYPVFPGIEIAYHDVHAASAATQRTCAAGCLEIHHCREGRIAYPYGDACFFLAPGDLAIVQRAAEAVPVRFPTGHYHGITVTIDPARAPDCLSCFLEDVEVRPSALIEKFCADGACFVTRSSPGVAHIFSELYSVPEGIRKGYFKVKILELLLYLDALELGSGTEKPYFYRSQVETVKAIRSYLAEHLEQHITLEALSRQYQIPLTTMKACFKSVYGSPVNTYMRALRMDRAVLLLRKEPETSVTEIAGTVGYDSASKFAAAFRAVKGQTPLEYRRGGGNPVLSFPDETE